MFVEKARTLPDLDIIDEPRQTISFFKHNRLVHITLCKHIWPSLMYVDEARSLADLDITNEP
jgi:hypothetical protein